MARRKSNLVDYALEEITKRINNYQYSAGAVVSEVALAEELDISRTPIREAILRLIDIGILERTATKVVVKAINLNDIKEILQVREAVELMSMKLIIARGGLTQEEKEEITKINDGLATCISTGDFEKNFEQDFEFHERLVEYSGNSRLLIICRRINIQSQRFRWITMLTPARYSNTIDEHKRILDALLKKDMRATDKAIVEHLQHSYNNYKYILKDDKWINMMKELKGM
ncbi:MAG: GntR family transcriptional regulator [Lachnospiraceae bacterium]